MAIVHALAGSPTPKSRALRHWQLSAVLLKGTDMGYLRERWTEADVLALPEGEHDYFERKSGQLVDEQHFRETLAKATSAFANSGGGHLVLGQANDLSFDGVASAFGRQPTKDWLENVVRDLVSYPLASFRVHRVEKAQPSGIPDGRDVFVLDFGDSALAPHQAIVPKDKPIYYYRSGGTSRPAPHFFLEAMRQRFVTAVLEASARIKAFCLVDDLTADLVGIELQIEITVTNVGRVASYKSVVCWEVEGLPTGCIARGIKSPGFSLDNTLLPSLSCSAKITLGHFKPCWEALNSVLPARLRYRVVGEFSPGEEAIVSLDKLAKASGLEEEVLEMLALNRS